MDCQRDLPMVLDSNGGPSTILTDVDESGFAFLSLMFPEIAMRLLDGELIGRGLKMTTNLFSRSILARAAILFKSAVMLAQSLFVQVRKPNSRGFGAGFNAV